MNDSSVTAHKALSGVAEVPCMPTAREVIAD